MEDEYYYLRGRNLYKILSNNGREPISQEIASSLSGDDVRALILALYRLDGYVVSKSLENITLVNDREPLGIDWRGLKIE